nr:S41 family peptidase [Syntrophomonas palmitatica]
MRQSNKKWTALLVTVLFLWSGLAGAALAADGKVLSEVAGFLKENYVDPVPAQVLQAPTVDEMLKRLGDPYAQYYTKQEFENEMDVLNGEFMGIGVYFTPGKEGAEIFQLIKGSPAERAGIKKGDIITMAAGRSLAGMDKDAIAQIIKGPAGSVVQLKVKRGPNSITMAVTREKVTIPSVESEILGNNTGYIILREFGSHSADDIDKAIKSLEAKKAENWILDLRGNPGGFLEAAIDIAGDFMGTADTLIVEERSKKEMYQGNPGGHIVDGPW